MGPREGIVVMSDDHPTECQACGFEGAPLRPYTSPPDGSLRNGGPANDVTFHFCDVCASTMISKMIRYPTMHAGSDIGRTIGWVANEILSEIGRLQNEVRDLREELRERAS